LAEGFARFNSGELAQFFRYGLASLAEVEDHLKECLTREFINQAEFDRIWDLAEHAKATALNFMSPHDNRQSRKRQTRAPRRK
jgi:four helix bundle protein